MECQKCKQVLAKKGSHFICQGPCKGTFYRKCVKGLAADLKNGRNRFFCNNCEEEASDDEELEEQEDETSNFANIFKDIQVKVGAIPVLKKHLESITTSISLLSEKYDSLIEEHDQSKKKIQQIEKNVVSITNKCVYLEKYNAALEQKLGDIEQASCKLNIAIVGVEQLPGENLKELVSKIGDAIGVSNDDIEWVKRSRPSKEGKRSTPIVVGFKASGVDSRERRLAQRRKISATTSDIITGGSYKSYIFINEELTRTALALLWNAKKQLGEVYKYIWVSSGRILVKKTDGDKTICVRAEADIGDLLKK